MTSPMRLIEDWMPLTSHSSTSGTAPMHSFSQMTSMALCTRYLIVRKVFCSDKGES